MAVASGTRFGSYEITEPLGAGGMGEVYRAIDTTLEREVAIKVLPESFSNDENRVARFEQEAKTLAALNHPNIAHIYGLERSDGMIALAMELVDGPTLAERIAEGPLAADEALNIAMQIADALEAAHARSIVHRDLKPANVKLSSDGTVKVLDFGIAKALDNRTAGGAEAAALTTPAMTQAGLILGTAAYMSPEQARGKDVDERTDIWAFGCVLFEMLTGQPAFGGEDVLVTLARVLDRDTNMDSLPGTISPAIRHTIKLCLNKDPRRRVADIRDVRLALEGAFETEFYRTASTAGSDAEASIGFAWLPVAAAAFVIGAMASGVIVHALAESQAPEPRVERFTLEVPDGELLGIDNQSHSIAISRDGSKIVFATTAVSNEYTWYLRSIDSLEATPLRGTQLRFETPFFSPDGRWIGFNDLTANALKRIPVLGGPAITLTAVPSTLRGASWGENDMILYGTEGHGLWQVAGGGGEAEQLTVPDEATTHRWPSWLPGQRAALFTIHSRTSEQIALLDMETGEIRVLIPDGTTPTYVPSGHIIYGVTDGSLRAVTFDLDSLTVTGDPVPVLEDLAMTSSTQGAHYALADDGTLIFATGIDENGLPGLRGVVPILVGRDGRQGGTLGFDSPGCICRLPRFSPDGTRLAMSVNSSETGDADIWIWSLVQNVLTRLTFEQGPQLASVWSPDSERLAYRSVDNGGIFVRQADGTGGETRVLSDPTASPREWVDEDLIVYEYADSFGASDIGLLRLGDEPQSTPLITGNFGATDGRVSPDGRWIAYVSDESGRNQIYVRPFPDVDSGRWQVSNQGGRAPRWSADGQTLYFLGQTALMAVSVEDGANFSNGPPAVVFGTESFALAGNDNDFGYDVNPDGDGFAFGLAVGAAGGDLDADVGDASSRPRIIVVQNWIEELEQLVPTE